MPKQEQYETFYDSLCEAVMPAGKKVKRKMKGPSDVDVDRTDPKYKKARRQIAGWLSLVTGLAMASGRDEMMEYAFLTQQIVSDHFDEYWVIKHPSK